MNSVLVPSRSSTVDVNLKDRARELMACEWSYLHSRTYEKLTLTDIEQMRPERIYAEELSVVEEGSHGIGLASGVDVRLLTPEGEEYLFRRMNYFFFRANSLRSKLNPSRPNRQRIADIEHALSQAEQARAELVRANVRLVAGLSHKFCNARVDYEELFSEGNLILLNAIDKFDIDRGYRFSTYATHAVQRHFFRVLHRAQRRKEKEAVAPVEVLSDSLVHTDLETEPEFDPIKSKELLSQVAELLDERELRIIQERYNLGGDGDGKTLKVIACEMGLSKERVRQLQFRALEKLRHVAMQLNLVPETGCV